MNQIYIYQFYKFYQLKISFEKRIISPKPIYYFIPQNCFTYKNTREETQNNENGNNTKIIY